MLHIFCLVSYYFEIVKQIIVFSNEIKCKYYDKIIFPIKLWQPRHIDCVNSQVLSLLAPLWYLFGRKCKFLTIGEEISRFLSRGKIIISVEDISALLKDCTPLLRQVLKLVLMVLLLSLSIKTWCSQLIKVQGLYSFARVVLLAPCWFFN